jgi:putative DNA primase/helicase
MKPTGRDAAADHLEAARQAGAECLAAALDYLRRGWSPLAVCPPDHLSVGKKHAQYCQSPGKAPWGVWKELQARRATEAELREKWRDNPFLNVGIALGPVSGLVRLDVDGEQGEAMLLQASRGDLPVTPEIISGAGRGLLYAIPAGVRLRPTHQHGEQIHSGLSLLGEGSQTVMPPSRHKSGRRYRWAERRGPDEIAAAPLPAWAVALMADSRHGRGCRRGPQAGQAGACVREGGRNNVLTSFAGTMRRRGMSREAIEAALLVENRLRCEPPLDEEEVRVIAASVGGYTPDDDAYAMVGDGARSQEGRRAGRTVITGTSEEW